MYEIPVNEAMNWHLNGDYYEPAMVKTVCPICNNPSFINLNCINTTTQLGERTHSFEGTCRACSGKAKLWVICPTDKKLQKKFDENTSIWMLPIPEGKKKAIEFPVDVVPKRIFSAYQLAIQCFNSQIWSSAINECGRVIEGVTEDKFPSNENRKELKKILDGLDEAKTVEATLFRSILELSSAIRLSRKSGSHFQYTDDPDANSASKVIELTEHTLEYFYALPEKVKQTRALIDELERSKKSEQTEIKD